MEELGKYQSIQDRIKRLTKNQSQNNTETSNTYVMKFKDIEDTKKQNTPQFTLSKKRQPSNNDYKALLDSISPKASYQNRFQSTSYGLGELSQQEPAPVLRKSESEYMLQKSARFNKENRKTPREISNYAKRNQSFDDITALLNQKYPSKMFSTGIYDSSNLQQNSFSYNYEVEPLTKRRQSAVETKKNSFSNTLTKRQGFTQIDNYILEKYKADIGDIKIDEELGPQKPIINTDEKFVGRMLNKCRSGTFERVPGKIVRNK